MDDYLIRQIPISLERLNSGERVLFMGYEITRDVLLRAYRLRESRPNYLIDWANFKSKNRLRDKQSP